MADSIIPTEAEALEYIGFDYAAVAGDSIVMGNARRALSTAVTTLRGAVGEDVEDYLPGDARARELILIYFDDLYSNRGVSAKVSGSTRRLVSDMELQLRMELRNAREEAAT